MRRGIVLGVLVGVCGFAALKEQPPAQQYPKVLVVDKLKDNLYVITSSTPGPEFTGGNSGVFVTDSGVIVA